MDTHHNASLVVKKGLIVLQGVKSGNIDAGLVRSSYVLKA